MSTSMRVAVGAAVVMVLAGGMARTMEPPLTFSSALVHASPAVVNVAGAGRTEEGGNEPERLQELLRWLSGESPAAARSLGSGFIISADGEIVTTHHVVAGAGRLRVRRAGAEELEALLVGSDEDTDVALLRVPASNLPTVSLADDAAPVPGDWVVAMGDPFGISVAATAGIVASKGRFLYVTADDDLIQTDALVTPTTAGGPLVDARGRVVGLATVIAGAEGDVVAFAVPAGVVRWVVAQLRAHGRVIRGWVGVDVQPVTSELARSFRLQEPEGALVTDVADDGPAAGAGIRRGDVIVRWGEQPILQARALAVAEAASEPGTRIPIEFLRDGRPRSAEFVVRERPRVAAVARAAESTESSPQGWGLAVRVLGRTEALRLGLKAGEALVVTQVEAMSPAEEGGLEPGDVILQANRQPVRSAADLRRALAQNQRHALLQVRRDTALLYLELER